MNPRAPWRVFSVTSQICATYPNSVGLPSLPLRIGRASGSAIDTSRSVIFKPADATIDLLGDLAAARRRAPRAGSAARSFALAPRPRAEARAAAASRLASRAERAISRPACSLSAITCAFASPVRLASVLEIARTVLPTDRERSRTRTLPPINLCELAALARERPGSLQREHRVGRIADIGLHHRRVDPAPPAP